MSLTNVAATLILAFAATVAVASGLRTFAVRRALVDHPNERSLHATPVPRLGGVAFVGVTLTIGGGTAVAGLLTREAAIWLAGGLAIASVGLADDVWSLRASTRLLLQFVVATTMCVQFGVPEALTLTPDYAMRLPRFVILPTHVLIAVAALNIYNFMDGMDGLAGLQGTIAAITLAFVTARGGHHDLAFLALLVASTVAAFLLLNMPPATMFMGDAGSTFLGLGLVTLALATSNRHAPIPLAVPTLAMAPFLLDGVFTITRRLLRRERIWQAHRTHLYQRLVGTGLTHRQVLLPYAVWMAVGAASAVLVATGTRSTLVVCVAACLMGFGSISLWLAQRLQLTKGS